MNILNINVQDYIPDIVEAYTKVYGAEHRDVIEKRLREVRYIIYNDIDSLSHYLYFLQSCKLKELTIKFLNQIGIDMSKQQEKSYSEALDSDINTLMSQYIGGYWEIEPKFRNTPAGIKAWRTSNEDLDPEIIEYQKIKFINFLRGENATPITTETFHAYCETDEYKQFLEKIKEYLQVYDLILEEYDGYLLEIAPYQKYVDDESKRKNDMEENRRNSLYEQVLKFLQDDIKKFLDEKYSSIDEKSNAIFGNMLGIKSYVEYFSEEDENKLNDPSISENDKETIYYNRWGYFKQMDVTMDKGLYDFETKRELYEYCIQQEHIKKLIPLPEAASEMNQLRVKAYEECHREFIYSSQDFIENAKKIDNSENTKEAIYVRQKNKSISMTGGFDDESFGFIPIIFYAIKSGSFGKLDFIFLHEVCHAIEAEGILEEMGHRSGFDICVDEVQLNPYNSQQRKYERFNETITDIFAIHARQALHQQGIYLFEPKEIIIENVNDDNTHSIVKNLLAIFLNRYKEAIVRARLYGDMKGLYDIIGQENFEELNDVVNRVDSLEGLVPKLRDNKIDDPVVMEYHRQLERLKQIYANMEKHQSRNNLDDARN